MSAPSHRLSYRDVKLQILKRITDRIWEPGRVLPGEIELAAAFRVARATVNRAMRELADEGIVERRRKAGTRVRPSPLREARFEIPLVRTDIESRGHSYGYRLLSRTLDRASGAIAATLGIEAGEHILHVVCLHLADGIPYQYEDRWINLVALPAAAGEPFLESGPNEWLVRVVPYSQVEMSFTAVAAQGNVAAALAMAESEPVFVAERTTWWHGAALTHVRLSFARGHRITTRY